MSKDQKRLWTITEETQPQPRKGEARPTQGCFLIENNDIPKDLARRK